jgi:hypothetical protein
VFAVRPVITIECEVTKAFDDEVLPYPVVSPYWTVEVESSSVVHVIVADVCDVEEATAEMTGAVTSFVIVMALVVVAALPEESVATAVSVYEPFEYPVVFSVVPYGDVVSVARMVDPIQNLTFETATLSLASAVIAVEAPEMVAPAAGAVKAAVGAVVSGTATVTLSVATLEMFPAASLTQA